ncbi:APC family permease [Dactylosporangium darangshiense]|uniref:APC family permease n=1 Tax=Dactylosporangium darangshiense TaxID=579108 RepID=A0ABP8CTF1_9ACTN
MSAPFPAPVQRGRPSNVLASLERTGLGLGRLIAAAFAAVAPATVVFGGATGGWAVTGVIQMPLAYVAVAAVLALFSVGYVAMSRRIVNAGAFYSYITAGLGRIPGVAAAMAALEGYNAMQIGLYGGIGAGLHLFLATHHIDVAWWLLAGGAWVLVAILGLLRVELSGWILAFLLACELVVVLVFAVVHAAHPAGGVTTFDSLSWSGLSFAGFGILSCTAIAGFVGFESAPVYSEEARNARRTVPRAVYITLVVAMLVYAFGSWAMADAAGPDKVIALAKDNTSELPFILAQPYLGQAWMDAGHLLYCTSLFAALLSFHNTSARYAFALGREGVLPRWLGRFNRANAPVWGSLTQTMLAGAVLVLFAVQGWDPFLILFFCGTVLGGFGVLLLMTVTSGAVLRYFGTVTRRHSPVGIWTGTIAPGLALVLLTGISVLTVQHFDELLGMPATSVWRYALPASFVVVALLGVARALYLRAARPDAYAAIGKGSPDAEGFGPSGPPPGPVDTLGLEGSARAGQTARGWRR